MSPKIGRNDACPCGSGKKYKQCCGKPGTLAPATADSHEGAVGRALAWLAQHHRKAFAAALQEAIDDAACEAFDDNETAREAMGAMSEELWGQVQINFTEWLLAEGDIHVKGEPQRVAELLLGPRGPLLPTGQRAWLEQLAHRPMRLYEVTEVVPGEGVTLCDAVEIDQPPVVVTERAGSRSMRVGTQIGARVMEVAGQHQLSGAIYPFSTWAGRAVLQKLRADRTDAGTPEEEDPLSIGLTIMDGWLAQYLAPAPLPTIIDSATGEALVFNTHHYEVRDWHALAAALAAQPDVHGDSAVGWNRLVDGADGQTRTHARITAEPGGRRVAVLYRTAGLAEQGRAWFDALSGSSVKFLLQEVSDPKGLVSRADASAVRAKAAPSLPAGLDAEILAGAMETNIKRIYAHWADEPIPALGGQTPRQAMQSPAGLERVKGLLRSYEDGEVRQAAQQGRREISYQFLWDVLRLAR